MSPPATASALLGLLLALPANFVLPLPAAAAPALPRPDRSPPRSDVFDMDGRQVLQDEDHLGLANGRLTTGIGYRDVASVAGLWAPPFVSSNFLLDARVAGEKVPTGRWTWRPFQVERAGRHREVSVTSVTTLIHGRRAAIAELRFSSSARTEVPLELFTLGGLDSVRDWGFARPASAHEALPQAAGRRLTLRQGDLAIVLTLDSDDWHWETSGNLGHAVASLPARRSRNVRVVITIGPESDAIADADRLSADPAAAVAGARAEYERQIAWLFDRLPVLTSDNPQLVRWYNRSMVHFLMNRWEVPEFALHPYYSTGSVKGGCVANYLWNFGEVWEILPLLDPDAARSHIRQFLRCDLLHHFLFTPITGEADGPWYMVNQEKIIGLTWFYVLFTGDTAFLDEVVSGHSVRDHMVIQAMYGDDVRRPMSLIDYGSSNSHLELRRRYPYNHVMPDLNARRYASYLRAAALCDLGGRPAPFLRERAELLRPLLREKLWDPRARWFRGVDDHGRGELRYTVQMFKPVGTGVLDPDCEAGLLSHLNEREFLSRWGLHSLSKLDPAYDQLDIDNGGGGICTSFPPQIIERLYLAHRPDLAGDLLGRLLWWGDAMPYWGDSVAANCRDYRRDTPLQCTLDGVAAAQSVIFGVFGVGVQTDGTVVLEPHRLPFAKRLALTGLKIRGRELEVHVDGNRFDVRSGGYRVRTEIGHTIAVPPQGGPPEIRVTPRPARPDREEPSR